MVRLILTAVAAFAFVLISLLAATIGTLATLFGAGSTGNGGSGPSPEALADIPADYLAAYQQAAPACPGLDWAVLAGIGKVETNHGRLNAPGVHSGENSAGAAVISRYVAA